ncbi:MAG: Uma2 family endonuclease [Verrucomicrobia bacterium]|nr:Uma2 family endonuclease [Verrucomicrobiota bacterium]
MRLETSAGPLEDGDCLNAKEFLRRCKALLEPAKVELVEGIVQLDALRNSPQSIGPRSVIAGCLQRYAAATAGIRFAAQPAVLLDRENVVRPDGVLQILPDYRGGPDKDCIAGVPELIAEAIFSRGINDLRAKLTAYRRNGVREFIAWRVPESKVEWFQMDKGEYTLNLPGPNNTLSSRVFPGFVLNLTALLTHDQAGLARTLQARLNQPDHTAFVKRLAARRSGPG